MPARFRPEFERGGRLTQNYERCLSLWTLGEFDRLSAEYQAAAKEGDVQARNLARVWAAYSYDVEIDGQGRMSIPPRLRDFAGLSGEVMVTGAIDHIELWNPEEWEVRVAPAQEVFLGGAA